MNEFKGYTVNVKLYLPYTNTNYIQNSKIFL